MKKTLIVMLVMFWWMAGSASAGSDFDKMKALVGQWDATSPEGKTCKGWLSSSRTRIT